MRRRDFLKLLGAGGMVSWMNPPLPSSFFPAVNSRNLKDLLGGEYPFPYDSNFFVAAERVVFLDSRTAVVNVIPRKDKSLDIRLYRGEAEIQLSRSSPEVYYGVNDSFDIPVTRYFWGPEFRYRLEYRESGDKGPWKTTPIRTVKTPKNNPRFDRIEVVLISDDHTFDDADMGARVVKDQYLRGLRLSGDYVNLFLQELIKNPDWKPDPVEDLGKMMSGYCLASTIRSILANENPDFIIILGDTTGIGAGYKWRGLGLKDPNYGIAPQEFDSYCQLFWLRMRKMLSALTPNIPIYITLGNHDGEASYDAARVFAKKYRKKYFRQPGLLHGGSSDENYFSLIKGGDWQDQGGALFLILDNQSYNQEYFSPRFPEEWTLGIEQKEWFKSILQYESDWKFVFVHHVLGGWPRGTSEDIFDYAYGRGPLFIYEDYKDYVPDPNLVEQVKLTQLMLTRGVRANFYGHDHIFFTRKVGQRGENSLYGICVGTTKHVGEVSWYKGPLWRKHYGYYGQYFGETVKAIVKSDFWGPSGYTKLVIDKNGVRVDYVRSANNHPYTNLLPTYNPGFVVHSLLL